MSKYLLGVDNGCTMAKAALFTAEGQELAVASRKSDMLDTQPGWAEFDMEQIWTNAAGAIREVIERAGIDPSRIACVACAGHGNGLYLVDEAGRPVRNAIGSADGRARQYVDEWAKENVLARIRPKTMQAIWPAQPNALLRWLADHEPESIARASWALMCKDFVRAQLTGEIYMERTDMSGTSLLDVGSGDYDDDVLAAWGLAELKHLLPPLRDSAEICGKVTTEAASATGLVEGTPVAGGLFDIDACGLASGMIDEQALCMVAGTWGCNQYASREPVVSENVFMTSRYCIPGYYLMLEGSPTSASNLEWFVGQFFQAEQERASAEGGNVYDLCNDLVAATSPKDSEILFLPFLYGSHAGPDAKACLFGLDGWQTRGHVLRAIYEGVVFSHKWHVDRLLQFRTAPATIRLTGGAARSEIWAQMFADVFQVPVEVPEGTELGALGAAVCAAVAADVHGSYEEACAAMVRLARTYVPNAELADCYRAKYDRYQQMLTVMEPAWKAGQEPG